MRGTFLEEFEARVHSEINDCWFAAILCLSDQWIILLDNFQKKLKIFNINGVFISAVAMEPYLCGGIAATGVTEIAVTRAEEIVFYKIDNGKAELQNREIDLTGTGSVLKFDGEFFAVVVCDVLNDTKEIQVLDAKGQLQHTISGDIFGSKLQDVRDIEINKNKKQVYITDVKTERVVCVSYQDGKHIWEVPLKGGPIGLYLRDNRLIVSVLTQHALILLSTTGDVCGEIEIENTTLRKPEYMDLQQGTGKLFLSCFREDKIKVFKITT